MIFQRFSLVKKIFKAYALVGVLHVLWKIYQFYKRNKRASLLWKQLPGQDLTFWAKDFYKHMDRLPDWCVKKMNQNPKSDLIRLPLPVPVILVNTPRSVKWLLKDEFDAITKPRTRDTIFELLTEFLGSDGIFVLRHGDTFMKEHKMWEKQRKITSKIFTKNNMKNVFYQTFIEKSDKVINKLSSLDGKEFDIQEMFFSFTMDSIEKFFMGTEVNTVEGGMSHYAKAFDGAHYNMMKFAYGTVVTDLLVRLFLPYPFGSIHPDSSVIYSPPYQLNLKLKAAGRRFNESITALGEHIYKYIKETKSDKDLIKRQDIIANFLNSKADMTDKEIHDVVLNLTIAGRDTTACALSWLIFELTQNKEVQDELCKEIDIVLKGKNPTMADLEPESMPYLNGVIYETLRLHPSVPLNEKLASKDIQYYDGTIIPEGTIFFYSPYALGRNETMYPKPNEFRPNRWIPFNQPSLYEFPVFQAGPRFCLGKDMAIFEIKLLVTRMLQKFKFSMRKEEAEKISYSVMLTLSVVNDETKTSPYLYVTPTKREF